MAMAMGNTWITITCNMYYYQQHTQRQFHEQFETRSSLNPPLMRKKIAWLKGI